MMAYSCSLIPKKVDVVAKPVERQIAQPILPRELSLKAPYWYVVSDKNIDVFLERVKNSFCSYVLSRLRTYVLQHARTKEIHKRIERSCRLLQNRYN